VWRTRRRVVLALLLLSTVATAAGASAAIRRDPRPAVAVATQSTSGAPARGHPTFHSARSNPFGGRGMWIWVLARSDGGDLPVLEADAHQHGISTLIIKSGDGSSVWPQFSAPVLSALHASRLRVCAWQYVYGNHPISEAYVGAAAVRAGADCLVVDAESEYEGKYVQAQAYLGRLRALIGRNFPVALAGFPYMDYHPSFPYSVFLGPGGAQFNVPQMYWRDIGTSVDAVYAHTFAYNTIYQRPIFPLGQVFESPPARQIRRFRQLSRVYGASNVSWWDWQEASAGAWRAVSAPAGTLRGYLPSAAYATLARGARGDLVVWAQEHLVRAGEPLTINGSFDPATVSAVEAFQSAHALSPSGVVDPLTWAALLRYPPARVKWVRYRHHLTATMARAGFMPVPASASLRAKAYEIPRSLGAGRP
jgi:hypothetical protein